MKNVMRLCSIRVIVFTLHLSIVDMLVCLISWFQLLTVGKSIYKSSKYFDIILVLLVLVENVVFISIQGVIMISSSFSNWSWLSWINLMVVVRSIFIVFESFKLLLTFLLFFSKIPSISWSCCNMNVIIYLQTKLITLSIRTILPLIVENHSGTKIFDNLYLLRSLSRSIWRARLFLLKMKIALINLSLSTSFIKTSSCFLINASSCI